MTLAPWRSPLSGALHRNRSLVYSRYLQLATVRANGRPANRTVVFRGFLDDSNQLQFVTDARSAKANEISQQPWGEVCWYFPKTREQFRLSGRLTLVDALSCVDDLSKARQQIWQNLSDAARTQFAWADPGEPRDASDRFSPDLPDAIAPLANFCLLLLEPDSVDHLELRGNPQNRYHYRQTPTGLWQVEEVNP